MTLPSGVGGGTLPGGQIEATKRLVIQPMNIPFKVQLAGLPRAVDTALARHWLRYRGLTI